MLIYLIIYIRLYFTSFMDDGWVRKCNLVSICPACPLLLIFNISMVTVFACICHVWEVCNLFRISVNFLFIMLSLSVVKLANFLFYFFCIYRLSHWGVGIKRYNIGIQYHSNSILAIPLILLYLLFIWLCRSRCCLHL